MDLKGKSVIYIGGFGGIGKECLNRFLNKKVKNLAILDLKQDRDLMDHLRLTYANANVFFVRLDVTDQQNINTAYTETVARMDGNLDLVINGCGLLNERNVDMTIQINLLGVINSCLNALPYMDKSAGGRGGLIVNISSVVSLEPSAMFPVYAAAKCGVTGFTRSLANPFYLKRTGIAFMTICPGLTDTALLHDPISKAIFNFATPMSERIGKLQRQTASECADNLIKAVQLAKNGAVLLLDLGEMREIEMPVIWRPTSYKCSLENPIYKKCALASRFAPWLFIVAILGFVLYQIRYIHINTLAIGQICT